MVITSLTTYVPRRHPICRILRPSKAPLSRYLRRPKNPSKSNKFKLFFILCYSSLTPFLAQNNNNKKKNHGINAINNLSLYKIRRNQINIFSSGESILGCLSYCFLAEDHTLKIPQQKETVIDMFTLYKVILIRVEL